MTNYFDLSRFINILRVDFMTSFRKVLVSSGAIIGIVTVLSLLTGLSVGKPVFAIEFAGVLVMLNGFITSATLFKDLHQKETGQMLLTLPGSSFEKYVSRLLFSNVGHITISLITVYISSVVTYLLASLFFGSTTALFNPFAWKVWEIIQTYFIVQSLFFFAAIYFTKNNFFKLILSSFIIQTLFSLFIVILVKIIFGDVISNNGSFHFKENFMNIDIYSFQVFGNNLFTLLKLVYFWLLAPFFWITGFFHFKEYEV